jgi:hypothetical protein
MSLAITAAQRDALYDQILDRLSGIGDIEVAIQSENYDAAERIGREYSDDLRLLLDDLGIGDGDGEPVELTAPPEVLRRILPDCVSWPRATQPAWRRSGSRPARRWSEIASSPRHVRPSWPISTAPRPAAGRAALTVAMSFLPRLRQSCRSDALRGHPSSVGAAGALQGQDSRLVLNRLFLSGILATDPQVDEGRNGDPVTLLLIAFPAPDAKDTQERMETASCEVEVPSSVAERHSKKLRAGESIFVTGQLTGGGGVIATEIHSGPAPEQRAGRGDPLDRSRS